eukprot:TRINITY_DN660_c0_g1_i1.p2 TRINITY_DN660_c0_g1~~TRINITY_DN660_c0_g1_i1.p2  ORF type:complete len:186 (+),score=37.63 TRINITY_DN660_c0_g1_i1:202-759(+)
MCIRDSDNTVTSDAATLTVYDLPVVIASNIGAALSATEGFATYQWYYNGGIINGADASTYTAIDNGNYYVHVTDAHNCANNSNTVIIALAPPLQISGDIAATQNPICAGGSTTLSVEVIGGTGTIGYLWTPGGATTASNLVTPDVTTTYTVQVSDDLTSVEASVVIIVNPLPTAEITHVDPCTLR